MPAFVRRAIDGMTAVMAGAAEDLRDVPLDLNEIDDLRRAVYAATRAIPAGLTRTYGEIARAIDRQDREGARDVGSALAKNPFPIIVPCHRVVAANGALRGFSRREVSRRSAGCWSSRARPGMASRCSSANTGPGGRSRVDGVRHPQRTADRAARHEPRSPVQTSGSATSASTAIAANSSVRYVIEYL